MVIGVFRSGLSVSSRVKKTLLPLFACFAVTGLGTNTHALEESGHNMVAQLMVPFIKGEAANEMKRLFGADWKRELIFMAPSIQANLNSPRMADKAILQLTLFNPGDEGFDPDVNCPENACSVGAILESEQVLRRSSFSDQEKRDAVLFIMHYLIQLHVPINCGFVRDMGGQRIYLKNESLQPVSFSWIWNMDLYRQKNTRWFTYAQELFREIPDMPKETWIESLDPRDWAFESHQIAKEQVYPLALDGRYSAELVLEGQKILEPQLIKAAYRTAAFINNIYGEQMAKKDDDG